MKLNWPGCVGFPAWPGFLRCMGWETVVSLKSMIKPENNEVQMEVFEIETERLQLRQFRVEDAQDVFAIFSDE